MLEFPDTTKTEKGSTVHKDADSEVKLWLIRKICWAYSDLFHLPEVRVVVKFQL